MRDRMTYLREQSKQLLAKAQEMEAYDPKTPMDTDFWAELKKVCALAGNVPRSANEHHPA